MRPRFKVIVPSYNSVKWLRKTLDSIKQQTYTNYDVCVIDDASTQKGQREIVEEYCTRYNWEPILREKNCGALANIVEGIKRLLPTDEDVILLVDGDDWLYHKRVFSNLANIYASEPVHITYGQYVTYPRWQLGLCKSPSEELLRKKNFREAEWIFSHVRTFKYKIWKHVKEEDLKDDSGEFFKTTWDLAFMYPLLEMTGGESCKFVNDIQYVYNLDNPLNDCVAHAQAQAKAEQYIRGRPVYPRLFYNKCRPHNMSQLNIWKNKWVTIYRKLITPKVYFLAARKFLRAVSRRL